ncbi:MAG TPA: alkaline phosphatase family protein [Candidatus Limnocylindrales bacterium]|nr:alkaline phosphatase family protein [Candidatus Limnocylindrales bacterium]
MGKAGVKKNVTFFHTLIHALLLTMMGIIRFYIYPTASFAQTPCTPGTPKHFQRVLIIVLENQNYEDVMKDSYFRSLAQRGANFTNFHGLFHPSYSNYLAMVSGKEIRTHFDWQVDLTDHKTIADLLQSHGLRWKNYAEGYPDRRSMDPKKHPDFCFTESRYGRYARKHVPFVSFIPSHQREKYCANIVPASQFAEDLRNKELPEYAFYTPDMDHNGHDTDLAHASRWLQGFLEPLLQDPDFMARTLLVITFDESGKENKRKDNHIYTVFLGGMVKPGDYHENYNHFNVLRTIEDNFCLGTLAEGDSRAQPIDVWK